MMAPLFFHVDMDAFYAAIEQRDNHSLRGKPVLVGGRSGRGVVAACSYEARKFGVHSALPMNIAIQRCPDAVVVPVRMEHYRQVSRQIQQILMRFAPVVETISIDEAFLDLSGTERLLGAPVALAQQLKETVREQTGLTISVGIGPSRFIAKLASEVDKPDGLYRVETGDEETFVASLELKDLWGLGKSIRRRLERLGVTTVAALRQQRIEVLRGHFGGSTGQFLYNVSRGIDPGVGLKKHERHSISAEQTFEKNLSDRQTLFGKMQDMAEEVIHRSIQENWRGRTIQVKYRFPPFETHTASRTLDHPPAGTTELTHIAMDLLEQHRQGRDLRLLGVGISGDFAGVDSSQGELFPSQEETHRLDPVILELRQRFGKHAINRARNITAHHPEE
jgi:DNA polymerase-4